MDESAFNKAMATGDTEALEKLLADYETLEIDDNTPDTQNTEAKPQPATPDEKVVDTATTAAEGQGDQSLTGTPEVENAERVVLSKDGKHQIPYDVLEQSRARASALEQENQQLRAIKEERDKLQTLLDKHQIDVNADNLDDLSDEALAELAEDFPSVGKGFKRLLNEIDRLKQTISQSQARPDDGVNEARNAFTSIPELVAWQQGDQDRLDYAIGRDKELAADPLWSAKPVRERYLEAVRRTTEAFKPVQTAQHDSKPATSAKAPEPVKQDSLPNSPSDIGNAVRETATRGTPEYYGNMSQSQIQAEMARMSQSEYDKLMASIGF